MIGVVVVAYLAGIVGVLTVGAVGFVEVRRWQSIATDLYNAHSGSAGQWERSRERYEKAVGK
jgi:hypothetical protein